MGGRWGVNEKREGEVRCVSRVRRRVRERREGQAKGGEKGAHKRRKDWLNDAMTREEWKEAKKVNIKQG